MNDDADLLRQYARNRSECAFEELVRRYLPLVYSTALRSGSGDEALARDVAQTVFIDLARRADALGGEGPLAGWLYAATRLAASTALRGERRRQLREQAALAMQEPHMPPSSEHERAELRSVLDEAMGELEPAERHAILLRFFQAKQLKDVGAALGISEDAARMRVSRSLEKLHAVLDQRGLALGAAALAAALAAETATAMPEGLAAGIVGSALAKTALAPAATLTLKTLGMTTLQKALIVVTVAALGAAAVHQARQAARLLADVNSLRQRVAPLSQQVAQLQLEREAATNRLALLAAENARLRGGSSELLQLRGEVGRLRADSKELANLRAGGRGAGTEPEEAAWLDRVRRLRERLDQTPSAKIPELQFLDHFNWLEAAKHPLDSEADYQHAFVALRRDGVTHFATMAGVALQKYLQANNGQWPADIAQLKSYFETPVGDDLLERYQVVPTASLPQADREASDYVIALKSPQDDGNWAVSPGGSATFVDNPQMRILAPAMKAAMDAAPVINGTKSLDIQSIVPYLKTPEEKAAYEELRRPSQ
jgi:RNA polymerase sigma factor (sigma-70 family)